MHKTTNVSPKFPSLTLFLAFCIQKCSVPQYLAVPWFSYPLSAGEWVLRRAKVNLTPTVKTFWELRLSSQQVNVQQDHLSFEPIPYSLRRSGVSILGVFPFSHVHQGNWTELRDVRPSRFSNQTNPIAGSSDGVLHVCIVTSRYDSVPPVWSPG